MLSKTEIERKLQEIKPILQKRYNVSRIGYFGSYAVGGANEASDLDLLVEFSQPVGWNFFTLETYLESIFGVKIDLVTQNAIKQQLRESVLNQVRYA